MIRIKLDGETPSKKNNKQCFFKNGKMIVTTSQRYKDWYKSAQEQLIKQLYLEKQFTPLEGVLEVQLEFHHSDKRKRDSDNGLSSILDLLVENKVLVDDNWQVVKRIRVNNEEDSESFCIISIDRITQ